MTRGYLLAVAIIVGAALGGLVGSDTAFSEDSWRKFCNEQQPTQEEWDALPFIMTFRDLPAHCFQDGLKVKASWVDFDDGVPLDVASVALDIDGQGETISLDRLPTIRLNPIVRDLYCDQTRDDWTKLQQPCPLPSIYAPPTAGLALIFRGPSVLLEESLPYDLTLSGSVDRVFTPNGRLFTRSLVFDKLAATIVDLSHLVIVGDLVLNKAQIKFLELTDTIVVGKVVLVDTTTKLRIGPSEHPFNLSGLVVHGGFEIKGSSRMDSRIEALGDGTHSIDGPLLLDER